MNNSAHTTSSPLSIAIVGAGKIGSAFAYQLARADHDVTVVARPGSDRLRQLQRDQGIVTRTGERAATRVADALDEEAAYDLVVVTTLAHQVEAVLPALRRSKARCVHFMLNTFDPERLRNAVGEHRTTFGMPMVSASLNSQGQLRSIISSRRKTLHGDRRWVQLFANCGVPSAFERNMILWLRCHVPICIGMEAISVAGKRRGKGASWPEAMIVARGLRAAFAIVRGLGHGVYPRSKSAIASSPTIFVASLLWFVSRVSPIRESLANGFNECRALIDEVVTAAMVEPKATLTTPAKFVIAMKPAELQLGSGSRAPP
jgi:2-dehydropantoate 2-reductase